MADIHHPQSPCNGFTLLELVIVLGVTGLIFAGLWGLLSGGNSQLQAQAAAQQYRQVLEATKQYTSVEPSAAPGISTITIQNLKDEKLLPDNFNEEDVFGNGYRIVIDARDPLQNLYRVMVASSGAVDIPDKVGAQVAALIGAEGGFIYDAITTNCSGGALGAPNVMACGAYNSFAFNVVNSGYATSGSGRIATLAYTADSNTGIAPYLYRKRGYNTEQRTMQDDMFVGTTWPPSGTDPAEVGIFMQSNDIHMGGVTGAGAAAVPAPTGGGTLNMARGDITNLTLVNGATKDLDATMFFNSLRIDTTNGIGAVNFNLPKLDSQPSVNIFVEGEDGGNPDRVLFSVDGAGRFVGSLSGRYVYETSDETLKKDIRDLSDPLSKIMQLKGHAFTWKQDDKPSIGLIAQEVQKIYPEIVSAAGKDGTLAVDYGKLVAPLIEAVKQLKKENDLLRADIEKLKAHQAASDNASMESAKVK